MRLKRTVAIGAVSLLVLAAGACGKHPTRVLDRPELSDDILEARAGSASTLWEESTSPPADGHYFSADSGDVDGDGLPDVVAGSFEPGGLAIWLGRDDGTWEYRFVPLPSSEAREVVLADTDGDGTDEILAISRGGIEGVVLLRAPEEGPWGRPETVSSVSGFDSMAVGDLNGDGVLDLATARGGDREDGGIAVWLGDGKGGFESGFDPVSGGSFRHVVMHDANGDGRLDLIAAGWGLSEGIRILHGDGQGGFRAGPVVGVPGYYRRLAVGDVTGDGRDDLVASTYRAGIRVFPGMESNAEPCTPIESGSFWSVLLTDADGDGTTEINVASSNGMGVMTWVHHKKCEFRAVPSGLPDRDTWFGLDVGRIRRGGPDRLIASGYDSGLKVFGRAVDPKAEEAGGPLVSAAPDEVEEPWARGNDTFTTSLGFPEYRLGRGDVVRVRLFNGETTQEIEVAVQSDGEIFVPARGIGSLPAAGLSPAQLKHSIRERAVGVWREPDVEVVVLEFEAHKVSLLGEVRSTARGDSGPGQYALEGKTRVVDFLSKHGGPTDRADLNRVQLIRPDGRSTYLNLYKAVFSSDQRENPILNDGDTVFVPSVTLSNRKVFVLGKVTNPGLLELRENITLLEAVARSGGFTKEAILKNIIVIRGGLESPEVIAVNVKEMLENGDLSGDVVLRNGDIVYVPQKAIVNVKEAVAAIQPFFDLILDALIIHELASD